MPRKDGSLTWQDISKLVAERIPEIPEKVCAAGVNILAGAMHEHLAKGNPIVVRRFGTFIPRSYQNSPKRIGLLFHPSKLLTDKLNANYPIEEKNGKATNGEIYGQGLEEMDSVLEKG
jgi:nucleoid DNA-binding protein